MDFIVKPYFGFLPGEPELWSAIHDYIEWFGGLFVAIGFLTRFSSLLLADSSSPRMTDDYPSFGDSSLFGANVYYPFAAR